MSWVSGASASFVNLGEVGTPWSVPSDCARCVGAEEPEGLAEAREVGGLSLQAEGEYAGGAGHTLLAEGNDGLANLAFVGESLAQV